MPEFAYKTQLVKLDSLIATTGNPNQGDVGAIAAAIAVDGWHGTILAQQPTPRRKRSRIFAGEHRWLALKALVRDGFTFPDGEHKTYEELLDSDVLLPPKGKVPVQLLPLADLRALRKLVADNQASALADTDAAALAALLQKLDSEDGLFGSLFDGDDLDALLARLDAETPGDGDPEPGLTLAERFLMPPFSVLDARRGPWQERKRAWLSLGIRSELGRPENLLQMSDQALHGYDEAAEAGASTGTSIFDPVLAEIVYQWFSGSGARVLDPFAGGSVRGVVASKLARNYVGIDLSAEQITANEGQAREILSKDDPPPRWIVGDARDVGKLTQRRSPFDLLFTCPPHFDLERYSEDPADLSNAATFDVFTKEYAACLHNAVAHLHDDRFAVIVVGNVRDDRGRLLDLVGATREAMEGAGCAYYNDAILVTAVGSLALRAARIFALRKLGRTHQYVLVFVKGDPAKAVEASGPVDVPDMAALLAAAGIEPSTLDA